MNERPGRTRIAWKAERQASVIETIADCTADAVDDREWCDFDAIGLINYLDLAEIELGGHYLLAVWIYSSFVGGVVPGQGFLDGCAEVLGAQAGSFGVTTSTRMLAEAWVRVGHGLPLPSTVTRISPSSSSSSPGMNISAYFRRGLPTTGVNVIALLPPT